jgi:hypothetical protein
MSTLRTAFFSKNLPMWERIIRFAVSIATIIFGLTMLRSPWNVLVAVGGIGFALTGLIGFCPACALVGRRLAKGSR